MSEKGVFYDTNCWFIYPPPPFKFGDKVTWSSTGHKDIYEIKGGLLGRSDYVVIKGMFEGAAEVCAAADSLRIVGTTAAVNDHTCPTCQNTRCSKTEKTCWKCGGELG